MPSVILGRWRRVGYFVSHARTEDMGYRCLGCHRMIVLGEEVVTCRSAHEETQNMWGPIENLVHMWCWFLLPPGKQPPLGRYTNNWCKYGEEPWNGVW